MVRIKIKSFYNKSKLNKSNYEKLLQTFKVDV